MKKRKDKLATCFGVILVIIGVLLPFFKSIYRERIDRLNDEKVEIFFNRESIDDHPRAYKEYIAILEIPSIDLRRGLVNKDSLENNISKNIQILNESEMPNISGGCLFLASHSGTSNISFFKDLDKLSYDDFIYVYYNNMRYEYRVVSIYLEPKDGDIRFVRRGNVSSIVLSTCSDEDDDKQLVILGELASTSEF